MQNDLDTILQVLNEHIISHSRKHNMPTPHCHSALRKHRGRSGAGHYLTEYHLLYDGLHAHFDLENEEGKIIRKRWAKAIWGAIIKNFDSHCDDDAPSSPRPWRGEKRKFPTE